jgi:hypothetical protein
MDKGLLSPSKWKSKIKTMIHKKKPNKQKSYSKEIIEISPGIIKIEEPSTPSIMMDHDNKIDLLKDLQNPFDIITLIYTIEQHIKDKNDNEIKNILLKKNELDDFGYIINMTIIFAKEYNSYDLLLYLIKTYCDKINLIYSISRVINLSLQRKNFDLINTITTIAANKNNIAYGDLLNLSYV